MMLAQFLAQEKRLIEVTLLTVQGSTPRDVGTMMLVAEGAIWGTIGGGQLEYQALEHARSMLENGRKTDQMTIPLGPEIGQCCGGKVTIGFALMEAARRDSVLVHDQRQRAEWPCLYIMGAGHVGRAIADLSQHLPVRAILIDSRADQLALSTAKVEQRQGAMPEADIQSAPMGSAFVVTTHDHGLDFMLTVEALMRGDAAYVGMIGSATKRAKFSHWCRDMGYEYALEPLICPIGADSAGDKRPSVIAAFVVAEILRAMAAKPLIKHQDMSRKQVI